MVPGAVATPTDAATGIRADNTLFIERLYAQCRLIRHISAIRDALELMDNV